MGADSLASVSPTEQMERACLELRCCLDAGDSKRTEDFLALYPMLAADDNLAVQLIYLEMTTRAQLGQFPQPEEYYDRFPRWRDRLQQLMEARTVATKNMQNGTETVPWIRPAAGDNDVLGRESKFGHYHLLEQIASTAMSLVYKARDPDSGNIVALKMIRSGASANDDEVARFKREIEATTLLRHPHIIATLEAGTEEGQLYFTMPLAQGGSLAQHKHRFFSETPLAVALMEKIARAVDFAHGHGIFHRDLKPSNVLLDANDEPLVSDFGLAKVLDATLVLTVSDQMLGTPAYMAPEQAAGQSHKVSGACDLWALGVMLYELLVGQRPFGGSTREELLQQIRFTEPVPPSRRRPGLDLSLEAVCLRCLQKDPADRYPSAGTLADELNRHLNGLPTNARPATWLSLGWRVVRRHAVASLALGFATLAFALYPVGRKYFDPDRAATSQEQALARGQSVALIDATGEPLWSRWRVGADAASASRGQDGVFTVHSWTLSLLELLPVVPLERYRVSIEARHLRSDSPGEIGIYVAQQGYPLAGRQLMLYTQLTYNDVLHPSGSVDANRGGKNDSAAKFTPVNLFGHMLVGRAPAPPLDARLSGVSAKLVQPAGIGGAWRRLVVDVSPEAISASWDGQTVAGPLATESTREQSAKMWDIWKERFPDVVRDVDWQPTIAPQGALGLIVLRGSAAFRNLVVEPVEGQESNPRKAGEP
jgi:serine/threonine-protein kinase